MHCKTILQKVPKEPPIILQNLDSKKKKKTNLIKCSLFQVYTLLL